MDTSTFLTAYDQQLRTDAETPSAVAVERLGPLRLVTFEGGRGFVTYQDLDGAGAETIADWVAEALEFYRADPAILRVEWKTRGHDHAPGLHEALIRNGFEPEEPESIMIGEARLLDQEVPLPDGVRLRRVSEEPDVRAMSAMQGQAFGATGAADGIGATDVGAASGVGSGPTSDCSAAPLGDSANWSAIPAVGRLPPAAT